MTTPGAAGIPGLNDIMVAAAELSVDISAQVAKAIDIMATMPGTIRAENTRLAGMNGGLAASQQGVQQDGAAAMTGASGQAAEAFVPHSAELNNGLTNSGAGITSVSELLNTAATAFEGGQNVVMHITPATAVALKMLRM